MASKYGPHAAGVLQLAQAFRDATREQWQVMIDTVDAPGAPSYVTAIRAASVGPAPQQSALGKLGRGIATDPGIQAVWEAIGGLPARSSARSITLTTIDAVAMRERMSDADFHLAIAPAMAAGIDCEAFSRMGETE